MGFLSYRNFFRGVACSLPIMLICGWPAMALEADSWDMTTLRQALEDDDVAIRRNAAADLAALGPEAKPAVEALTAALDDKDDLVRRSAASALGAIGPEAREAIPPLIEALGDRNAYVRQAAVTALASIGPETEVIAPELVALFNDEDAFVRLSAYRTIADRRWKKDAVEATMMRLLDDKQTSPRTQHMITGFLEESRSSSIESVPTLINLLQSPDAWIRHYAASILGNIGRGAKAAVPVLIKALDDDSLAVSLTVAEALERIGPDAIEPLTTALNDPNSHVQALAARTLGSYESKAASALSALTVVLATDDSLVVRGYAAKSLGQICMDNCIAIPALAEALQNPWAFVRGNAVFALGRIKPVDVTALGEALEDGDAFVRRNAAEALAAIGRDAKRVENALVEALKDTDADVAKHARRALERIKFLSDTTVARLVDELSNPDPAVQKRAVEMLISFGLKADATIPELSRVLLEEDEPDVRQAAAKALGRVGTSADIAVASLMRAMQDSRPEVRREAAMSLGRLKPASEKMVVGLTQRLADDTEKVEVRVAAANSLGNLGPPAKSAVPILVATLDQGDRDLLKASIQTLGKIGPEASAAVPSLRKALDRAEPDIRYAAAKALGDIGPAAGAAVPDLVDALQSLDTPMVREAQNALIKINLPAVDAMRALLDEGELTQQQVAVGILGQIGENAQRALDYLILKEQDESGDGGPSAAPTAFQGVIGYLIARQENDPDTDARRIVTTALEGAVDDLTLLMQNDADVPPRRTVARTLGQMGLAGQNAVPALTAALEKTELRFEAARALGNIATALRDAGESGMKRELEAALKDLEKYKKNARIAGEIKRVQRAVEYFQLVFWKDLKDEALAWIAARPLLSFGVPLYLFWVFFWLAMLWIRPLSLLQINRLLKPLDVKLPDRIGGVRFPLRLLLVVGLLNYRPRVLDAWVKKHMPSVKERFDNKGTVRHRRVHISIPVKIDAKGLPDLKPVHLQPTFDRKVACLLIWGEGGAGKTSLAFQIARWAMHEADEERLGHHPAIPVLIEHELAEEAENGQHPLRDAVAQQLQDMADQPEPVPDSLLEHLLRYRRILVIIDHLSEMSEHTRQCVRREMGAFPGNALLITSRRREKLDGRTRTVVRPMRIAGNRLSSFMEAYLNHRDKRELFSDIEFFDACRKLSSMVGERNITVLLAKLYAEEMIGAKKSLPAADLPDTIPALILRYLNELNRAVKEDPLYDRIVHQAAKVVAWECLRKTFKPDTATYEDILTALGGTDAEAHLKYLQDRLRLLQPVPPALDRVRLILDPLAEYLAAAHVVAENAGDEKAWRRFFVDADDKPGAPEAISGFLLAIRDCCLAESEALKLPDFVVSELSQRTGLAERNGADG